MASIYVVEPGTYLRKDGGVLTIERDGEKRTVPLETVTDVTLISSAQITSELIQELSRRSVPVVWMSYSGEYLGSLQNVQDVDIDKHLNQVSLLWKKTLYNEMAKKVVKAKAHNQITFLRRHNRRIDSDKVLAAIKAIFAMLRNVDNCNDYQKLMGYEGMMSREYFKGFSFLLPEEFQFEKRTRRPPKDEVNAMLSMGYNMLYNEIFANVSGAGLHPYIGFLHRTRKGHASLVSDLMEEWRTLLVDSVVLNLITRKTITQEMFRHENGGCYFTREGLKIFLAAYNKKLTSKIEYLQTGATYRDLLKRQVRDYVSVIANRDAGHYTPVEAR